MTSIRVVGIRTRKVREWQNGDKLLCHFDCEIGLVGIDECLLIKKARGDLIVSAPKIDTFGDGRRLVHFLDKDIPKQLALAAYEKYRAMGGQEVAA